MKYIIRNTWFISFALAIVVMSIAKPAINRQKTTPFVIFKEEDKMGKVDLIEKTRLNYDPEADVLYINFDPPQEADDSDITDEGVIIRLRNGLIVGLTILNATKVLIGT